MVASSQIYLRLSTILTKQMNEKRHYFLVQLSQVKIHQSFAGRSNSPNRINRNDRINTSRTYTSPYDSNIPYNKDNSLTQRNIELDDSQSCHKMIVKLSKKFDFLKTQFLENNHKSENKTLQQKITSLTNKLNRVQREYKHNLEIVSLKVDEILSENSKLKKQLEQCKEDREEEYEYLKQKQIKFLDECHEMMKIRKILDTELLDASKENQDQLIELKDTEIRTLFEHIDSFKQQINDQQKFLKHTYEQQLKKMHGFLQSTSDDQENEQTRQLKTELQVLRESNRKLEKRLKECNHEKSTKDDLSIEQLIREKITSEQVSNYFSNELKLVAGENEALKQEIDQLHQMINHRSIEFQFVQKQLNNEKDELLEINQQLNEQLKYSQQKDGSYTQKEILRLKSRLEQKERDNYQLIEEIENMQKIQNESYRFKKTQISSQLELNEQDEDTENCQLENEQLKMKLAKLESLIEEHKQSQENIVRLVYSVMKGSQGSGLSDVQRKLKESFLSQ